MALSDTEQKRLAELLEYERGGGNISTVEEVISRMLADAWDRGYTRADNGGSESGNPYR